jgi:hypothetical protein
VSSALPWSVSVTDSLGAALASGSGTGPTVDWTWDASLATVPGARWQIAVAGATPVVGVIGQATPGTAALAVTGLATDPETISPNDDDQLETSTILYTTTAPATVTVTLLNASGQQLAELMPATAQSAGEHTLSFDGLGQPDGVYTIVVTAVGADGVPVIRQARVTVTRTLALAAVRPAVFSPNGDGKDDTLVISFQLAASAVVRVRVLREGVWVATPFAGALQAGLQTISWDGKKRIGKPRDGAYSAVVDATDAVGSIAVSLPFVMDAHPPVVRLSAGRPPRLWVSEPATLTIRVNGSARTIVARSAGTVWLRGIRRVRTLVAVARDAAGNRGLLVWSRK